MKEVFNLPLINICFDIDLWVVFKARLTLDRLTDDLVTGNILDFNYADTFVDVTNFAKR